MTSLSCNAKQEPCIFKERTIVESNKWTMKSLVRCADCRFQEDCRKGEDRCNSNYWNFYLVLKYNSVYSKL